MPDVDHALRNALQSAITAQPESVAAGADFPDFLYACGDYADHHDAGEAAHWPQFHVPAVRYVRNLPDFNRSGSAVPYTWSADTQKLVAFIYGLTVHYVTDEIWEGWSISISLPCQPIICARTLMGFSDPSIVLSWRHPAAF